MRHFFALAALGLASLSLPACAKEESEEPLSQSEALDAVEETSLSSQASRLTGASIDISTSFTLGSGVESAVRELRTFVASQLPCAETTVSDSTLSLVYGAKPGNCTYREQIFSGRSKIKIARNDAGDVVVDSTWTDFANGKVKVNGTAQVTWSVAHPSRRIVHNLAWTRLSDGRTGTGSGDLTQVPLDGDIAKGIVENGTRAWEGHHGRWDLDVQGVQMRWTDPAPQAGAFVLQTPKAKSVTMSFSRVDADSVKVTVTGGTRSFNFVVNGNGIRNS